MSVIADSSPRRSPKGRSSRRTRFSARRVELMHVKLRQIMHADRDMKMLATGCCDSAMLPDLFLPPRASQGRPARAPCTDEGRLICALSPDTALVPADLLTHLVRRDVVPLRQMLALAARARVGLRRRVLAWCSVLRSCQKLMRRELKGRGDAARSSRSGCLLLSDLWCMLRIAVGCRRRCIRVVRVVCRLLISPRPILRVACPRRIVSELLLLLCRLIGRLLLDARKRRRERRDALLSQRGIVALGQARVKEQRRRCTPAAAAAAVAAGHKVTAGKDRARCCRAKASL